MCSMLLLLLLLLLHFLRSYGVAESDALQCESKRRKLVDGVQRQFDLRSFFFRHRFLYYAFRYTSKYAHYTFLCYLLLASRSLCVVLSLAPQRYSRCWSGEIADSSCFADSYSFFISLSLVRLLCSALLCYVLPPIHFPRFPRSPVLAEAPRFLFKFGHPEESAGISA